MTGEHEGMRAWGRLGWSTLLVGGIVLLLVGIAGIPTIGSLDLSALTVIASIAIVIGDAIWVGRTS